ncbi:S1C family serine protease [Dyella sp. LX-66]|uniref:S1 family peptidase n=1 Tax=unclassified Dyella TaxID=2634549 RepID=UPI001BE124A3|nr:MULTISPECIES: serine protease [unclassified Dyella]MBT2117663.1 S1C family serine protease [Dyella sp. LX-1]MBT2141333.1 S1C family serine protease [Dyella sp. LX-66]
MRNTKWSLIGGEGLARTWACALALWLAATGAASAASLDAALLPKIQGATFEVVAAKPADDPLTYEKALPLDLLPFQERTDKYHSIGTAFAIGKNQFVTAGHVLLTGVDSLWGAPSLRDANGKVYAIDKIEKFDLRKDFVVFTVSGNPGPETLDVDTKPVLNQEVYAVGNALGTGVVIRDGLYTSDTPEQQDGAWKWMRFSAAASPGNSGGPLLNKEGKVIGVVLMKSANENLNYALQMGEVLNAPAQAVMESRVPFRFDIFSSTLSNNLKGQFALPLGVAEFFKRYEAVFNGYIDNQLKEILSRDTDKLFPRGDGSNQLLYGASWMNTVPGLIVRNSAGEWGLVEKEGNRMSLAANGYVQAGVSGHNFLLHLRRPDNLPADKLYNDPSALSEQLCKMGIFMRPVGSEQVRITSLGKPVTDSVYVDHFQRRWQLRVWTLPFANTRVITFALPVPDGYAMLMRFASADDSYDNLADMRALLDYMSVGYEGSLAQWKDFLKNTALLPDALKSVHIQADYQQRFSYSSNRLAFSVTPQLQKIEPESTLTLGMGFVPDHGKVVWDVNAVALRANPQESDRLHIERNVVPPATLDDDAKSYWDKLLKRRHPYEGTAYSANGETRIGAPASGAGATPGVVYSVFYAMAGSQGQDSMRPKLDLLMKDLKVSEQ